MKQLIVTLVLCTVFGNASRAWSDDEIVPTEAHLFAAAPTTSMANSYALLFQGKMVRFIDCYSPNGILPNDPTSLELFVKEACFWTVSSVEKTFYQKKSARYVMLSAGISPLTAPPTDSVGAGGFLASFMFAPSSPETLEVVNPSLIYMDGQNPSIEMNRKTALRAFHATISARKISGEPPIEQ